MIDLDNPPRSLMRKVLLWWVWAFLTLSGVFAFVITALTYHGQRDLMPGWAIFVCYGGFLAAIIGATLLVNEMVLIYKEVFR